MYECFGGLHDLRTARIMMLGLGFLGCVGCGGHLLGPRGAGAHVWKTVGELEYRIRLLGLLLSPPTHTLTRCSHSHTLSHF